MTANSSALASGKTPAKPHHEPEENEARLGALLDGLVHGLDAAMGQALHHGLEAKVREIVARHLPPETPATVAAEAAEIDRVIELRNLAQFLDDHARRAVRGSPNAARALHFRDFLRGEVARLMGRGKA